MRFVAVLNRHSGGFAEVDLDTLVAHMRRVLTGAGHSLVVNVCEGEEVVAALCDAARDPACDVVLAGGGDGTASAAAGALQESDKALAVLPAGTMNLFARSIGIPLDFEAAIAGFANARRRRVDMASANGRPFVHQYSIGLHPQLLRLRSHVRYRSRQGKMLASTRAALVTLLQPPRLRVALSLSGKELVRVTSGLSVTNNLFGEGHLPYADMPDKGMLGIYITRARRRRDLALALLYIAIGRWRRNEQVEIHSSDSVHIRIRTRKGHFKCAIDGELGELERETTVRIHPAALGVLVPNADVAKAR